MDHHHSGGGGAEDEETVVTERLRQKLNEANSAVKSQLSLVQDHVHFTLQKEYFRCAYECFDRRRNQEEIEMCVENCSVPVLQAQNLIENEMAEFQERLSRGLMVCQDKFESAKLQHIKTDAYKDMESCVEKSIKDNIDSFPHLVEKLKSSLSIPN
ncbi:hypothetical protein LguiA_029019 [Lonicera macranthoides]